MGGFGGFHPRDANDLFAEVGTAAVGTAANGHSSKWAQQQMLACRLQPLTSSGQLASLAAAAPFAADAGALVQSPPPFPQLFRGFGGGGGSFRSSSFGGGDGIPDFFGGGMPFGGMPGERMC